LVPFIAGFSLVATPDNQIILRKQNPNRALPPTPVALGTWKQAGDSYEVTLSNNKPDTVAAALDGEGTLQFPMQLSEQVHVLVFNKEM